MEKELRNIIRQLQLELRRTAMLNTPKYTRYVRTAIAALDTYLMLRKKEGMNK